MAVLAKANELVGNQRSRSVKEVMRDFAFYVFERKGFWAIWSLRIEYKDYMWFMAAAHADNFDVEFVRPCLEDKRFERAFDIFVAEKWPTDSEGNVSGPFWRDLTLPYH